MLLSASWGCCGSRVTKVVAQKILSEKRKTKVGGGELEIFRVKSLGTIKPQVPIGEPGQHCVRSDMVSMHKKLRDRMWAHSDKVPITSWPGGGLRSTILGLKSGSKEDVPNWASVSVFIWR